MIILKFGRISRAMKECFRLVIKVELNALKDIQRIYDIYQKKIIKPTINKEGNAIVGLFKNKKSEVHMVGRLVYKTFNDDFDGKNQSWLVLQKDGNKLHNELNNLYIERRKKSM